LTLRFIGSAAGLEFTASGDWGVTDIAIWLALPERKELPSTAGGGGRAVLFMGELSGEIRRKSKILKARI
jgi:hypothetical protein